MNLFVFGSEDYAFDNGAIQLISHLKEKLPGWNIKRMARPEQLMHFLSENFVILDVAAGIKTPMLITDTDNIKFGHKVTAHDMDLAAFLKILKEVGQLPKIAVVALPNDQDANKFKDEVLKQIKCASQSLEK